MAAAGAADLVLDEGLNAERDAVDSKRGPGAGFFGGEGAGCGFDGGLQPRAPGNRREEGSQFAGGERAGRAAAQVNGFRLPLPGVRADFGGEREAVALFERARKDSGREVAVGAFLRAERVRDVDAGHSPDCSWVRRRVRFGRRKWSPLCGLRRKLGSFGHF